VSAEAGRRAHAWAGLGDLGHVAPMGKQGPAGWDHQGNRITKNKHVIPGAQIREMMRNPQTRESDFTNRDYRNADTVRVNAS
jgi:hypothetical protein